MNNKTSFKFLKPFGNKIIIGILILDFANRVHVFVKANYVHA